MKNKEVLRKPNSESEEETKENPLNLPPLKLNDATSQRMEKI